MRAHPEKCEAVLEKDARTNKWIEHFQWFNQNGKCSRDRKGEMPDPSISGRRHGIFDFGTIFFFIAAVIIFLQLRNVLGRRTGSEKPPFDPYTSARSADAAPASGETDNVVSLPRRPGEKISPPSTRQRRSARRSMTVCARFTQPILRSIRPVSWMA